MADLRATIASLRAVRAKMTPGPWRSSVDYVTDGDGEAIAHAEIVLDARGIVATHSAADALLDALDRIAAVVDRTDPTDGTNDYRALDEIRAILDGAREGGG